MRGVRPRAESRGGASAARVGLPALPGNPGRPDRPTWP
eukprot:CAMPEP_0116954232 /NCGR_PEP_ID=MMETSP0467-20121206/41811_1 /TAXON_ID=283647 /ORGANISM="Mesodinium pulex, Strain SPMC105" /LENGTH=37 /DNA_ID= /DNA_START= /DNA_END= /DNA_ORIENTATION=